MSKDKLLKIDLHTHSTASPDGGISASQYQHMLDDGTLDFVAVTDHDLVDFALALRLSLGERIIVGEEVASRDGELIGLFLHSAVEPGQSAAQTADAIKSQGGLVYVPHPFETVRRGITPDALESIADRVDIVEACNGRSVFQNFGPQAAVWARRHAKKVASSSDAHTASGVGHSYSLIVEPPTADNLVQQLAAHRIRHDRPPLLSLLAPKINRLKKQLGMHRA